MSEADFDTYDQLIDELALADSDAIKKTLEEVIGAATESQDAAAPVAFSDIPAEPLTRTASPAPNRLEINQFVRREDFFSLYILALSLSFSIDESISFTDMHCLGYIQRLPQGTQFSFFQIGGIHGQPYVPWPNQNGRPTAGRFGGYCAHRSVIFPTWHRPYTALYEVKILYHQKYGI